MVVRSRVQVVQQARDEDVPTVEEAYARMSARAAADGVVSVDELKELAVEDVESPADTPHRATHVIGFTPPGEPERDR